MRLFDYFGLAIKNFKKKKFRTGVNIFAISIGVMLIITMVSLGSGLQMYFQSKVKELYNLKQIKILSVAYQSKENLQEKLSKINSDGVVDYSSILAPKKISEDLIDNLSKDEKIDDLIIKYEDTLSEIEIEDRKLKDVSIAYYKGKQYLSSEEDSLLEINSKEKFQIPVKYIAYGENLKDDDVKKVLIREDVANITFGFNDPKDAIGKKIILTTNTAEYDLSKNHKIEATISGLIDQRFFQPSIVVSKDIIEDVKNFYSNDSILLSERGCDSVEVAVKDVEKVSTIVENIEQDYGYSTESVQTVARTIDRVLIWLKIALSLIGLIVVCIASLDVINTMVMSIYERTRSIGLMKATGASRIDVLSLFLVEGGSIGLIGGLIGVLFSIINLSFIRGVITTLSSAITNSNSSLFNEYITIDLRVTVQTLIFVVILTVLASLYPALKASKLNPIDALKHD